MPYRFALLALVASCSGHPSATPDAEDASPFAAPQTTMVNERTFPWVFYDSDEHASVFENFARQWYGQLTLRAGSTVEVTITAMASSTHWVPDGSKHIDAAVFEGAPQGDGSIHWTQIGRAFSKDGVIAIKATSTGDDLLHVLAVEADAGSYDTSASPSVVFRYTASCSGGDHSHCALGSQPGDACTVDPATCDGPFSWCFAPPGTCGNTGTCVRTDVVCDGLPPQVCDCEGMTQTNECWAHSEHKQIRHRGACP